MSRKKKRRSKYGATFDLTVKDGNTPIFKVKERLLSELDEVLEILRRKL